MKLLIITLSLLIMSMNASTQDDLDMMSLEDLMDIKVEVASQSELTLREAPGIITVLTEKDIKNMGARDLKEILTSVPGFSFGHDVAGVISTINRGIWAQEGRLLVLLDGIELNETSYGTLQLGNHIPAGIIEKIEIIRGPGSALYGGFAELGVINITTKKGKNLNGVSVSTLYSGTESSQSRHNNLVMIGAKENDLSFSVKAAKLKGNSTNNDYLDYEGTEASLDKKSDINNLFLNVDLDYKGFYTNILVDNYRTTNPVLWGQLNESGSVRLPVNKDFLTTAYNVGYDKKVSSNLDTKVYYKYKRQNSWLQPDIANEVAFGNNWRREITREVYGLKAFYDINSKLRLDGGYEKTLDKSYSLNKFKVDGTTPDVFGHNSKREATLSNDALFSQLAYKHDFANITLGLRYDIPDSYNETLVPRFAVTKIMGNSHLKFLYAKAFRAPTIENISLNKDIKPEITTTAEIEYGYIVNSNLTLTANIFDTQVKDIIVYSYNSGTGLENYDNYDLLATRGLEFEVKFNNGNNQSKLNYSYYQKNENTDAKPFESSVSDEVTLGAPQHKVFISNQTTFMNDYSLTPSIVYYGRIYTNVYNAGVTNSDGENLEAKRTDDQYILNLWLTKKNFLFKDFEIGVGVNNILDSEIYYAQPYEKPGDYKATPYPGLSREGVINLSYNSSF